jgi:hypothetical protein
VREKERVCVRERELQFRSEWVVDEDARMSENRKVLRMQVKKVWV